MPFTSSTPPGEPWPGPTEPPSPDGGARHGQGPEGEEAEVRDTQITRAASGGDGHPGTPWTPPQEPPSPDGDTPPGDGTHRK